MTSYEHEQNHTQTFLQPGCSAKDPLARLSCPQCAKPSAWRGGSAELWCSPQASNGIETGTSTVETLFFQFLPKINYIIVIVSCECCQHPILGLWEVNLTTSHATTSSWSRKQLEGQVALCHGYPTHVHPFNSCRV